MREEALGAVIEIEPPCNKGMHMGKITVHKT